MPKMVFKRREKKLLLTGEQFRSVKEKITEHGMVYDDYCVNGSTYSIYNVYYDDPYSSVIRRSVAHPKFKEKFRVRAYSVPKNDDDLVYLEIKRKIKGVVVKRRVGMSYKEAKEFLSDGTLPNKDKYLDKRVLKEIQYYFSVYSVSPAVFISYDRIAFFDSKDPEFRVTFDRNIQTRRFDLSLSKGAYGEQLLGENEVLMEIKISGAIPKWFTDILAEEKIYISGFSKYGNEYSRRRGHEYQHIKDRRSVSGCFDKDICSQISANSMAE